MLKKWCTLANVVTNAFIMSILTKTISTCITGDLMLQTEKVV